MLHIGSYTKSRVYSKSISLNNSVYAYRGLVKLKFCEKLTIMSFRGIVGRTMLWKGFPGRSGGLRCALQRKSTLSPVQIVSS